VESEGFVIHILMAQKSEVKYSFLKSATAYRHVKNDVKVLKMAIQGKTIFTTSLLPVIQIQGFAAS
jgi:hypothetical protein